MGEFYESDDYGERRFCGKVPDLGNKFCHAAVCIEGECYGLGTDTTGDEVMISVKAGNEANFFLEGSAEYRTYHWTPLQLDVVPSQTKWASVEELRQCALAFDGMRYRLSKLLRSYDGHNCQELVECLILRAYGVPNARLRALS